MWRALHIYLHRPVEEVDAFLVRRVGPLVARLLGEGRITSWFFIRYWVDGPHVRLRLRDADDATLELVRAALAIEPDPSTVDEAGWQPDGTIVECLYEPE